MKTQTAKEVEHIPAISPVENGRLGWKLAGAVTALEIAGGNVSRMFSAEAIRGLQRIENEKLYIGMGFERFADFLNSDDCFIGKNAYYERLNLLNREGEQIYDLLNGLEISMRKRKQLGQGNIEIEGDTLVLKDTEERIAISDRKRLLEILTVALDENSKKAKQLEKGKEDFRRERERRLAAEDGAVSANGSGVSPIDKAHMLACAALSDLADHISKLKPADCQAYLDGPFNLLVTQYQRINDGICEKLELETLD
jgi:hypothetical protein